MYVGLLWTFLSPMALKWRFSPNMFCKIIFLRLKFMILLRHHRITGYVFLGCVWGAFWLINKQIVLSIYRGSVNTICQKMTERQNKAALIRRGRVLVLWRFWSDSRDAGGVWWFHSVPRPSTCGRLPAASGDVQHPHPPHFSSDNEWNRSPPRPPLHHYWHGIIDQNLGW